MSREAILERVRGALGRRSGQAPEAPPPPRIRIPEVALEARIESFFCQLGKLGGKTCLAKSAADAGEYVARLIGGQPAVASNAPFLRECGIAGLASVETGFEDRERLRAACAGAAFGITSADWALADTGSLVMIASPEEARLISLLPPVHVAVVPRAKMLTGLDELLSILPRPAEASSSMVLITGPSRTADLEQILVRGVHGPGEVYVVVV
jgi:L-lactate dehydrogenase complex protein LldG